MLVDAQVAMTVIAVLGALFASVTGYMGLRRKQSGQVATTDADRLWKESEAIRKEYKQIGDDLRVEVREAKKEAAACRLEAAQLQKALHAAQEHGKECDKANEALRVELDLLRSRIVEAARKGE